MRQFIDFVIDGLYNGYKFLYYIFSNLSWFQMTANNIMSVYGNTFITLTCGIVVSLSLIRLILRHGK